MSLELPPKPNLEHLKKQAKDLLPVLQQGDASLKLADAQHAIAREYGFINWSKLKEHVEAVLRVPGPAEQLSAAVCDSDAIRTAQLLEAHLELKSQINQPMANYEGGMQALLAAVQRTDRRTIDVLLQGGADINARSQWWAGGVGVLDECGPDMAAFLMGRGALLEAHSAARLGMFDELRHLVAANPNVVRSPGANGQTPLHFASTIEIAEYLLEKGADIDAREVLNESTPAQHMVRVAQARHYPRDRQEIARHLVARGCRTDVLMASALGDLELVRGLLDADPSRIRTRVSDVYFPKQDARSEGTIYIHLFGLERTPHMVARDFGHEEVFQFLMSRTPQDVKLKQACELGDEATFRTLLKTHPHLIATLSDEDRRRLPDAAQNNNLNAVRLMLQAGWPVDVRGELDLAALDWAAWQGNAEMVREVLRYQPRLDLKDCRHGMTALMSSLHGSENSWHRDTGDYAATVRALLDAGAKPPEVTDDLEASDAAREVLLEYAAKTERLP